MAGRSLSLVPALVAGLWLASGASLAEGPGKFHRRPALLMDRVTLTLAAEEWVKTSSADIVVSIDVAPDMNDIGKSRDMMLDGLKKLAPEVEWKITSFAQTRDNTGRELWSAVAQARVSEKRAVNLMTKSANISKPGFKLAVAQVFYQPSLAETEAGLAKLRQKIVAQAQEELTQINKSLPGRNYRLHAIDFGRDQLQPPEPIRAEQAYASNYNHMDLRNSVPLPLANKLSVLAKVTLVAKPPKVDQPEAPKKEGDKPTPAQPEKNPPKPEGDGEKPATPAELPTP